MGKQLFGLAAALLLAITGSDSAAQEKPKAGRMPMAISCGEQMWEPEARRYELEGSAVVGFDLDDEGQPINPRTVRSSGWKLLDGMSESAALKCRYAPPSDSDARRINLMIAFKWTLAPRRDTLVPAALVPGTCAPSDRYAELRPLTGPVQGGEGLLVRFLIDPTGKPFGFLAENSDSPETFLAAAAYVASCSFKPALYKSVPGPGNLFGRLIPKQA